jgi:hypothetical protein
MSTSDIELAVTTSRRLESLLETRFGASGRGLHEKLASVEAILSPEAMHHGRYVATMRNKVVHEDAFSLPDRDRFLRCAQAFEKAIGGPAKTSRKIPWRVVIFPAGLAVVWSASVISRWVGIAPGAVTVLMASLVVLVLPLGVSRTSLLARLPRSLRLFLGLLWVISWMMTMMMVMQALKQ